MKKKHIFKSVRGRNCIIDYYDQMLNTYLDNTKQYYLNTSYGSTFIIEAGEKDYPPIVLLHGSGMSSSMWLNDLEKYSKKNRVFAIDILGEPGKSEENRLSLEGDDYVKWLFEIFNNLQIKKADLVGLSLGGWLSIKIAEYYPDRVKKIVLISPAGIGEEKKSFSLKFLFYKLQGKKGINKFREAGHSIDNISTEILRFINC